MVNSQLLEYIKQQLAGGLNRETLHQNLISAGWASSDISEAFSSVENTKNISVLLDSPSVVKKTFGRTLLLVLITIFVIGGGVYFYLTNRQFIQQSNTTSTQTSSKELSNSESVSPNTSSLVKNEIVDQKDEKFQSHTLATIPAGLYTKVGGYLDERIVFSGDGNEVMYLARTSDIFSATSSAFYIYRKEKLLGEFLEMITFEPAVDGHGINYAAIKKTGTSTGDMVINDVPQSYGGRPAQGTQVVFSVNGKHYAYVQYYQKGELNLIYDNEWLYKGGIPVRAKGSTATLGSNVVLTAEGAYLAFSPTLVTTQTEIALTLISQVGLKKQAVIIQPITKQAYLGTLYDDVLSSVVFSPDLKHYAYRAQNEGLEFIVLDVKPQPSFEKSGVAWAPVFSLDSNKISYAVTKNSTQAIDILTGSVVPYVPEDFLNKTAIVESTRQLSAENISKSATVFDKSGKNYANIVYDFKADEKLASELKTLMKENPAQASEKMKNYETPFYVEVNGVRINRLFGFISTPKFDSTGKHVMFGAREGRKLQWVVYEIVGNKLVER